ncbi:MAG: hypothetical protein AAF206_10685 [Bacteroidota bacterium]
MKHQVTASKIFMGFIFAIASMFMLLFSACVHDPVLPANPGPVDTMTVDTGSGDCDTLAVSYGQAIKPILQDAGCIGCHNGPNAGAGVQLGDHASVAQAAGNGSLLGTVTGEPGFAFMPPSGDTIPDCDILLITAWINQGLPNN